MLTSSSARLAAHRSSNTLWLTTVYAIAVALFCGSFVTTAFGAPAKLDTIAPPPQSPFPLEVQPPQFVDAIAAALKNNNGEGNGRSGGVGNGGFNKNQPSAIDSYGNPIAALKPIDTPDGRKVISAQGLQFEIPNYASGITEIKKPADDLLPPFIDPIAVGVPSDSAEGTTGTDPLPDAAATAHTTTTVDVENAHLVELKTGQSSTDLPNPINNGQNNGISPLPAYLVELNDPDIRGPVEYMPADDGSSLKVIAWDLLPPLEQEPKIITAENYVPQRIIGVEDPLTHNIKVSLTAGQSLNTQSNLSGVSSEGSVSIVPLTDIRSTSTTTTTPRSTTVRITRPATTRTTTTTTHRPTTTTKRPTTTTKRPATTTTTTRRPTTTSRTTTSTTTTTSAPLNPDDFFELEHGDSFTLPSWLADIDDPELDAAVTYIVPDDINEYNDTISRDILPPLEPYTDLNNIDLPAPPSKHTTTSTTSRPRSTTQISSTRHVVTTTTRRPTVSTPRPHWVRAYPTTSQTTRTTTTQRPHSFDDRFSSNHIAQSHDIIPASSTAIPTSKVSTSFISNSATTSTTTTTTQRPRLTTPTHQQHNHFNSFNQGLSTTNVDHITNAEVEESTAAEKVQLSNSNPFLPARPFGSVNAGKFSTTKATTTTTTTTTTTPATPVDENPFDSATIPSWLADFDYPELGPGVPFIYNADDSNSDVHNDLLPPSQLNAQATEATKPVFITSPPASLNSLQISPSLSNRHDSTFASASTSTTRTFAFNNFPSKVTTTVKPSSIHNPFAQVPNYNSNSNNPNNNQEENVTLPPIIFIPPTAESEADSEAANGNDINNRNSQTDNLNANIYNQQQQSQLRPAATAGQTFIQKPTSSSFNTNFAAPFESATAPGGDGSSDVSSSADQDFGSSTKTTFTKSNEGKVITNNILGGPSSGVATPTKQFGFSTVSTTGQTSAQKDFQHSTSSSFSGTSQTFNKAVTPSGFSAFASTQQSTNFAGFSSKGSASSTATVGGIGKYTGGFGGSPGVLGSGKLGYAVPAVGTAATSAATPPKLPANPSFANRISVPTTAGLTSNIGAGLNKYQGTFGGPPGVLIPFDNVKSG